MNVPVYLHTCRHAAPGTFSHECGAPAIAYVQSGRWADIKVPYCAAHAPVGAEPLPEFKARNDGPLFASAQGVQAELF